ncbi:hypothetical protein CBS101457_006773 [Exobasidium rhododendri]|nr:hypothetical protein CBS101457_006773 [Exobasidium rhododendri]
MSVANGGEGDGDPDGLAPTWRHLSFYEASKIRDASDFASSPAAFRLTSEIAAISHSTVVPSFVADQQNEANNVQSSSSSALPLTRQQSVLMGDIHGQIHVFDAENYSKLGSWKAFYGSEVIGGANGRVTHISCDQNGRVVTLGEDDGSRFPVIRIWDLAKTAKSSTESQRVPQLLTEGKVQHGSRPNPIASLAHTASLSFLSIALADGSVLLLRGLDDVLKTAATSSESANTSAVVLPKFKVAFQPAISKTGDKSTGHEAVTGLGFAEVFSKSASTEMPKVAAGKQSLTLGRARNGGSGRKSLAGVRSGKISGQQIAGEGPPEAVNLFIVTLSKILRYTVLGKGAGLPASVVDDVGCALGCARLVPRTNNIGGASSLEGKMVIARDEAVYIVGAEGREMTLAYEGPKSSIMLAASQLVIVSPPIKASAASDSATVRNYVAGRDRKAKEGEGARRSGSPRAVISSTTEVAKITIFDLDNKLIAYSGTFEGGVREVWAGNEGDICVLSDDGSMTRVEEKTLRQKLDILFRKSLYLLAVNVAKSHASRSIASSHEVDNIDPLLADIHRKYADSLYEKGDFEGAMNQFVKTIGYTQPSYVIRKFLDAQRITNLTTYLQELHSRGMANSDHTTLLLNCYTKLKDVTSLDRFIKRPVEASRMKEDREGRTLNEDDDLDGVEQEELPFDLDTAIRVCRQAGYFEHAAYLAKRYDQHDEYIRIQIEDLHDFQDAINHIRGLSAEEAERNLLRYGKVMLDTIPRQTTDLLIELCSGAFQPVITAKGAGIDASKIGQNKSAAAAYLSYLQVGGFGKSAVGAGEAEKSGPSTVTSMNRDEAEAQNGNGTDQTVPTLADDDATAYSVPLPRLYFAHFISHPREFERFLETVALARWDQSIEEDARKEGGEKAEGEYDVGVAEINFDGFSTEGEYVDNDRREQMSIWNTLLELYLTSARAASSAGHTSTLDGAQRLAQKGKAVRLLRQFKHLPYDISQALVVCSQEDFTEGIVLLYERMGMHEDILHLYMDQTSQDNPVKAEEGARHLMECLSRYGPHEPHLYPILLRYFASSEKLLSRNQTDLEVILDHIEDERLMSPLEIVQTLSKKGVASVGLIRSFLIRSIQAQQIDIETNEKLTSTYRVETMEKLQEIDQLNNMQTPKVFQQTKCNACGGNLDLPIVHFMCKHSFHSRCLGEEEKECPICAKSHGIILEIRKNNLAFGERHDL